MFKAKKIAAELEKLSSISESGGGFGDPEALAEHERKIELLKHQQILEVNKSNARMTIFNIIVALLNVGILVYQVFYTGGI